MPEPNDLTFNETLCVIRWLGKMLSEKLSPGTEITYREALGGPGKTGILSRPDILDTAGLEQKRLSEVQWKEIWGELRRRSDFELLRGGGDNSVYRYVGDLEPVEVDKVPQVEMPSVGEISPPSMPSLLPSLNPSISLEDFSMVPEAGFEVFAEGLMTVSVVEGICNTVEYQGQLKVKITF
jgi:hypothetical protein